MKVRVGLPADDHCKVLIRKERAKNGTEKKVKRTLYLSVGVTCVSVQRVNQNCTQQ
jgi:hypothetical protein